VTEPYSWQTDPKTIPLQVPNAPPVEAGFGFLLSGGSLARPARRRGQHVVHVDTLEYSCARDLHRAAWIR
jgi:hypothetical protein